MLTATGNQGEANAEANMTFNGSLLTVTGDTKVIGDDFISSASESGVNATKTILTVPTASGSTGIFDYFVSNGTAFRGGTVIVAWNGSTVAYTDYSADSGDSTGLSWVAQISGSDLLLRANISSGTWTVKVGARVVF